MEHPMRAVVIVGVWLSVTLAAAIDVPKTWDEKALHDWATPVVGLNLRPGHFSEAEYYAAPADNLRTYPVYFPGREPAGYWDMLQTVGPKPLIEPATLQTDADWVRAGQRVFEEFDTIGFRTFDQKFIARARAAETFARSRVKANPDGTLPDLRWVPTAKGVALSVVNCAECHVNTLPDGTRVNGAPTNEAGSPLGAVGIGLWGASPFPLPDHALAESTWRSWAVPWLSDDIHAPIRTMPPNQAGAIFGAAAQPGLFPRWNGSGIYPTKIPDLIGMRDRKYIDHTATHQHRGPGDLMRYAALVTYSDSSNFGPHQLLPEALRTVPFRATDEALYALARYIYSLEPPPNPHVSDPRIPAGRTLFDKQGCAGCHTPPLYTNNKLTLAEGFTPPPEHFAMLDILKVSVGTDPGLALKTRKGTGYYKVPSLKGVWYRGRYLHDGSLTSLEEMFDPARLQDTFAPSGFNPPSVKMRAVKGHEFGLKLPADDRAALIAFLKSL
jgi:hypothetical protein